MPNKRIHQVLAVLPVLLMSLHTQAMQSTGDALPVRDLNPFNAGYELPPALPSTLDTTYRTVVRASYAISNISLDQQHGSETAIADAELHRWQLTITHSFNSNWIAGIELPYQSVSGGSLDSFIENFHRALGLPNGNRGQWPRNRLLIDYSINNQSLYHLENRKSGMADISARIGRQIDSHAAHSATAWFTIKLPTGNANQLTGSGAIDAALTLSASQRLSDHWHAYEQVSLSLLGRGKRLHDEQKQTAWSGLVGVAWTLTHSLDVASQLNWHSSLYDSDIRMLGPATQLTIGPRYRTAQWQAWLAITEDIAVDTAPDVQFQFALSHHF